MVTCWWVPTAVEPSVPEGWAAEFAAQTVDNPHDKGDSNWDAAQTAAVRQLYCVYGGKMGRYHGGPQNQPHQPGAGPGFAVGPNDLVDPTFKYFGSGREALVSVQG